MLKSFSHNVSHVLHQALCLSDIVATYCCMLGTTCFCETSNQIEFCPWDLNINTQELTEETHKVALKS